MGQSSSKPVQTSASAPGKCPVSHNKVQDSVTSATAPAACPVDHQGLNPLNQIPSLDNRKRAPNQKNDLPLERTVSSIPHDAGSNWVYPSPQQFYNALVRKGWEAPEEHIETMVDIHNFLNERAWQEVMQWEVRQKRQTDTSDKQPSDIQLVRFRGRPGDLSPKARVLLAAGWLLPSRFNSEPPFDRHDWVVRRSKTGEEVRYVIDYYSAPPEPDGSPVFSLDVRPALDSFSSLKTRIAVATEDMWSNFRQDNNRKPPDASNCT